MGTKITPSTIRENATSPIMPVRCLRNARQVTRSGSCSSQWVCYLLVQRLSCSLQRFAFRMVEGLNNISYSGAYFDVSMNVPILPVVVPCIRST